MATACSRVLFLGCSQRKRTLPTLLRAIDRYDGPCYRVVRAYLRGLPVRPPTIWILSAKYGLIQADRLIPWYDHKLVTPVKREFEDELRTRIMKVLALGEIMDVFVSMGRNYEDSMRKCLGGARENVTVKFARGRIGGRASQLRQWLYPAPDDSHRLETSGHTAAPKATLLGVEVCRRREDVAVAALHWLSEDGRRAYNFETWFVRIGQQKVSAKWLVGRLTDLPVGRFRTSDARRVLASLGVKVEHV